MEEWQLIKNLKPVRPYLTSVPGLVLTDHG